MSKRDGFYNELFDDDGLRLPNDPSKREESAQRLFGATLVAQMDIAIENALSLIDSENPYPTADPPTPLHEEHQVFCDAFAAMTDDEVLQVEAMCEEIFADAKD